MATGRLGGHTAGCPGALYSAGAHWSFGQGSKPKTGPWLRASAREKGSKLEEGQGSMRLVPKGQRERVWIGLGSPMKNNDSVTPARHGHGYGGMINAPKMSSCLRLIGPNQLGDVQIQGAHTQGLWGTVS